MALMEKGVDGVMATNKMNRPDKSNAMSAVLTANRGSGDGAFAESIAEAVSQTPPGTNEGLGPFPKKRPPKFR